ncbi:hypothetical protein ACHAAC_05195 [Aeromicrobium sp. CF4.19]|uniref:hypothetical protein n=1 Tax=Aeromicrobium sp. CF4.19 TaxID=3373082 RepID=UPI003EE81136
MPSLDLTVQPGEQTLVNVPTIFHTQPGAVDRSVDLLGNTIDVRATATSFTWHHGDGTSRTTSRPGRPYPSKDVTHTYQRAADVVRPRVDTTYTVRYRIGDGTWTDLGETLTATGTPTSLRVRQAAPVLTGP